MVRQLAGLGLVWLSGAIFALGGVALSREDTL
jgi:hypothetical protein